MVLDKLLKYKRYIYYVRKSMTHLQVFIKFYFSVR